MPTPTTMANKTTHTLPNHDYHISTLPNGVRAVHLYAPGRVAYTGVVIAAGARDDGVDTHGLAHFVEHTVFKGTDHRSSRLINRRMESIGGELNAYTTKEDTVIFTNAPTGYTERALDLLFDLIAFCNFPAREIEKEREVVIEEIYSYLDSPADAVYDDFDAHLFAGSELGHTILGTPESVKALTPADCRSFISRGYRPENIVVYCLDSTPHARFERLVEKYFGRLESTAAARARQLPAETAPFDITDDRSGHQAHTVTGMRVFGRHDPRRHALFLLNNHLGGPGMSSILNQQLRERLGYVYTVESNVALMSDCGMWSVYFGSDAKVVDRCMRIIDRELQRLASDHVAPRQLEAMKRQYIGQITVSGDSNESLAMSMGKSLSFFGSVHHPEWTAEQINSITADGLRDVAAMLAAGARSRLTLC